MTGLPIVEKSEVSLANSFALRRNLCSKSLIKTRKSSGPKIESCGTLASIRDHFNDWPLRTTL